MTHDDDPILTPGQDNKQILGLDFHNPVFPVSALAILAWVAGLIWPSAVHVTFHPDTDYQILYSFWMYPGALALSFLTSFLLPSSAGWDIASAYQSLNRHPEPMP